MSDFGSLAPGGEAPVGTRYAVGASGYSAGSCIGEYITTCGARGGTASARTLGS